MWYSMLLYLMPYFNFNVLSCMSLIPTLLVERHMDKSITNITNGVKTYGFECYWNNDEMLLMRWRVMTKCKDVTTMNHACAFRWNTDKIKASKIFIYTYYYIGFDFHFAKQALLFVIVNAKQRSKETTLQPKLW